MHGSRVSDFSIERILSPQLGHKPQVTEVPHDGYLRGIPGGFSLDLDNLRPPAPVPLPMSGRLQYRGMSFGEEWYPFGAGFYRTDFSGICPNSGVCVYFSSNVSADVQPLPCYHGCQQSQHRQKPRMRTVFTDSQSRQLEALFELTDYPAVEVRAEVARRTGLSEETVRVWFKNRRARRKRSSSSVKCPSSSSRKTLHLHPLNLTH